MAASRETHPPELAVVSKRSEKPKKQGKQKATKTLKERRSERAAKKRARFSERMAEGRRAHSKKGRAGIEPAPVALRGS